MPIVQIKFSGFILKGLAKSIAAKKRSCLISRVKTSWNGTENCRLSASNFTKNELLHRYFSRILTANFRAPIFQNTSEVAASVEAYSGPC